MKVELAKPDRPEKVLVADIGGTNARFAVCDLATLALSDIESAGCAQFASLTEAAKAYLAKLDRAPRHAAIAVAAPITGETVDFTNSPWELSRTQFCRDTGLRTLLVLNDFEALAKSLPYLADEDLTQIGGGAPVDRAAKVVLGPGTGLGAAGLVWSPSGWIPVPGEGGHITLASAHADHFAILERLHRTRDHVSAERVLSGPGLCELYRAVAEHRGAAPEVLEPGAIVARAVAKTDKVAEETMLHFVTWLGRYAGDVALVFGARGGVYLGGGIPPRIIDFLTTGAFRENFEAKGRMREFLRPIPVYVIGDKAAALKGAGAALREAFAAGDPDLLTL